MVYARVKFGAFRCVRVVYLCEISALFGRAKETKSMQPKTLMRKSNELGTRFGLSTDGVSLSNHQQMRAAFQMLFIKLESISRARNHI